MSTQFILRPVATALLTVAVLVLGLLGYARLPVAALPTVDFPTIQVTTSYPGASPDVVATSITAPLEHFLGQITGLQAIDSVSGAGTSRITLQFALSRPIDVAAQDVQAAIDAASGWMPTDKLPTAPTYRRVNPADAPIIVLALASDTLPSHVIGEYAQTSVVQKLSQIRGVGAVTIEGGLERGTRLRLDPSSLAALGLSLDDVRNAVTASTVDRPKGSLEGTSQSLQIGANDQLLKSKEFLDVVIAYRNGAPIHLRDVGTALDGMENDETASTFGGRDAILIDVQRQPGANALDVVDSVRALLPSLHDVLPRDLSVAVVTDRSVAIRAAISDLQFTLAVTVGLVVVVILLFLRKLRAAVIPSVALPVTLVATFGAMALFGFSLDNLSLMGLTIASGFVVDDAIVMVENIVRHVEAGEAPIRAALKGARQIGFTIVSLTASLVAVFIPLLLMGGLIGRLFREFAITLSLSIAISAVVSLTLTPMMCARVLTAGASGRPQGHLARWSESLAEAIGRRHMAGVDWVLGHRAATLLAALSAVLLTGYLYVAVPKGFLPQQDTGLLVGTTDAPQDISFAAMSERQRDLVEAIRRDPDVVAVSSLVGVGTINATLNTGRLYIDIGPSNRRASAAVVAERLDRAAAAVPGIALHIQPAQDLAIDTKASRNQYQFVVQGLDDAAVRGASARLVDALKAEPAVVEVASDEQNEGLRLALTIDRDAAARYGLSIDAIDQVLWDALGQRQIAVVYGPLMQYRLIMGAGPDASPDPGILDKLYVTPASDGTSAGTGAAGGAPPTRRASTPVPLSAVVTARREFGPLAIAHRGLFPAATVSFDVAPGSSLGAAMAGLRRAAAKANLPDAVSVSPIGVAAEFEAALASQGWLILAAVGAVYIVLGILYESFVQPLTILSTLPSAGVGALLGLLLFDKPFDLIALIGVVLLIGIVKKNAIMLVDFALDGQRNHGLSPEAAIREACRLRFRPIMMTTFAALFGALPLALSTGVGAEQRQPLGLAIVGGLLLSQVLTLYTTPVVYLCLERLAARVRPSAARGLALHPAE